MFDDVSSQAYLRYMQPSECIHDKPYSLALFFCFHRVFDSLVVMDLEQPQSASLQVCFRVRSIPMRPVMTAYAPMNRVARSVAEPGLLYDVRSTSLRTTASYQ